MSTMTNPNVVIHSQPDNPLTRVVEQLLNGAGYHVESVTSCDDACVRVAETRSQLLILSGASSGDVNHALDRLALLPTSDRPHRVAILNDELAGDETLLARKLPGTKVQVFTTASQAHGLLNVVKRLTRAVTTIN